MNEEDRLKKLAIAKEKYGRDFIHEKSINKPKCKKSVLPKSRFQFQRRPVN